MYKINLVTRDSVAIAFDAEPSESLLDAAARENIFLPAACREGGCGACRVTLTSGDVDLKPYSKTALTDADRASGDILLCRSHARGDLKLRAPFDKGAISFMPVTKRMARIVELSSAGSIAKRLVLRLDDDLTLGSAAEFLPGQFMELSIPETAITRAYSLANAPNWDGTLEFLIRLQPNGVFSAYLANQAKIGDALTVRGPQGSFTIDHASRAANWFGAGVAPMLSMLRHMAEFGDNRDSRLFFGVNTQEELFALDAINELAKALPRLQATVCVWKPGPTWSGFSGTPVDAFSLALTRSVAHPDIYVCGPPALIEATEASALAAGVARDRIFSEKFSPA